MNIYNRIFRYFVISVIIELKKISERIKLILKTKLKEILEGRKMTQKQLSELTGLRPNTISEIAKNTRDSINREHIGKIANALKIEDPNEILYFDK